MSVPLLPVCGEHSHGLIVSLVPANYLSMSTVITFYTAWIAASLLMLAVGRWVPPAAVGAFSSLFIVGSLLIMTALSHRYQLYLEPSLRYHLAHRLCLLAAAGMIFAVSYIAVRHLGVRSIALDALHTANLLFFACLLGHWLVMPLKRAAELVPLCFVMSLVDIYSVFRGPSKELTETLAMHYTSPEPTLTPTVDFLLIKLPLPYHSSLMPVFGVADWIIIVMLSAAAAKFSLDDNLIRRLGAGYVPVAIVGLLVTIFAARELGIYLPALPMIALCFLAVMGLRAPEILKLSRAERPALLLCAGLATALGALVLL